MPEVCPPLAPDPSAVCRAEVNTVVNGFVVQIAHPDARHRLQYLRDVAGYRPTDANQEKGSSDRVRRTHEQVSDVSGRAMVFVMKRSHDAPEAMKNKPVQQIFEERPEDDAKKEKPHTPMLRCPLWI